VAAGRCTGITLSEQIFVERGEVASLQEAPPEVCTRFRASVFWMGREPLSLGKRYGLRLATSEVEMQVEAILAVTDSVTLASVSGRDHLERNEVAQLVVRTRKPLALDRFGASEATGRFVIVDGYDIWGGGIVIEPLQDPQEPFRREARLRDWQWRPGEVSLTERCQRNGHRPGMVLFTGERGSGKARLARQLERRLFETGRQVYLLDGKNLQRGLCSDLSDWNGAEVVRRFGEVAQVLLRAGLIVVSTTNTFSLADHQIIRTLVHPHPVVTVHLSPGAEELPEHTDLGFLTGDELGQCVDRILEKLTEVQIL